MSLDNYNLICDDFYVDMVINTELDLPTERDTVLAFFERIQKQFPTMGCFYRTAKNEYCLEEDVNCSRYRWVTLQKNRIASGAVNPATFEDAYCQGRLLIELAPYMLSVNHLDINSLDVAFTMDFDYVGSHDEVIAEALFGSGPFGCLLELPGAHAVDFSPSVVVALSDDGLTQARISVESKTCTNEPGRQRHRSDQAISLTFTVRQYPSGARKFDALKSFARQCRLAEELMTEKIVPNFAQPLTNVIAQKRIM